MSGWISRQTRRFYSSIFLVLGSLISLDAVFNKEPFLSVSPTFPSLELDNLIDQRERERITPGTITSINVSDLIHEIVIASRY